MAKLEEEKARERKNVIMFFNLNILNTAFLPLDGNQMVFCFICKCHIVRLKYFCKNNFNHGSSPLPQVSSYSGRHKLPYQHNFVESELSSLRQLIQNKNLTLAQTVRVFL